MNITFNGQPMHIHDGVTLGALLREHEITDKTDGVAVALNNAVVPRRQWADAHLRDGDAVEVIHAVQGG